MFLYIVPAWIVIKSNNEEDAYRPAEPNIFRGSNVLAEGHVVVHLEDALLICKHLFLGPLV